MLNCSHNNITHSTLQSNKNGTDFIHLLNSKKEYIESSTQAFLYSVVENEVLYDEALSDGELRMYMMFQGYCSSKGVAWVSNSTIISKYPKFNDDSIKKRLNGLERKKYIFRFHLPKKGGGTIRFVVTKGSYPKFFNGLIKKGEFYKAAQIRAFFENRSVDDEFRILKATHKINNKEPKSDKVDGRNKIPRGAKKPGRDGGKKAPSNISIKNTYKIKESSIEKKDDRILLKTGLRKSLTLAQIDLALKVWDKFTEARKESIKNREAYLVKMVKTGEAENFLAREVEPIKLHSLAKELEKKVEILQAKKTCKILNQVSVGAHKSSLVITSGVKQIELPYSISSSKFLKEVQTFCDKIDYPKLWNSLSEFCHREGIA